MERSDTEVLAVVVELATAGARIELAVRRGAIAGHPVVLECERAVTIRRADQDVATRDSLVEAEVERIGTVVAVAALDRGAVV